MNRFSFPLFLIFISLSSLSYSQSGKIQNQEDIRKWMKAYDRHETTFIDNINGSIHEGDTLALLSPIIVCKTQLDYNFTGSNYEDMSPADSLTKLALYRVFSKQIHLRNVDFSGSISETLKPDVDKALWRFKDNKYNTYQFDSAIHGPKYRYAVIPYLLWVKTIPKFDPEKPRNEGYATLVSYQPYTWSRAHAFIFILDLKDSRVIYFSYESWWGYFIRPISSQILDGLFKKNIRPLLKSISTRK